MSHPGIYGQIPLVLRVEGFLDFLLHSSQFHQTKDASAIDECLHSRFVLLDPFGDTY